MSLTKHNLRKNTSEIVDKEHILLLNMLSTLAPTTPSTTRESSLLSVSQYYAVDSKNTSYRLNSNYQTTVDQSSKYKRSATAENSVMDDPSLCEKFSKVNTAARQLYSPNYPELYPNKSNCVVVLEG